MDPMGAVGEGLAWDWMGSRQQGHCVRPRLRWCVARQARQKVWPACMQNDSSQSQGQLESASGLDRPAVLLVEAAPSFMTASLLRWAVAACRVCAACLPLPAPHCRCCKPDPRCNKVLSSCQR